MSPLGLLGLAISLTFLAAMAHRIRRRRWQRQVRQLAGQWRMNYAGRDSLQLTPRIAMNFPIPGAAELVVSDLIYRADRSTYRYIFTAGFTVGVVHRKRRHLRAAAFSEARDSPDPRIDLVLAPAEIPLIEQYKHLAPTMDS